MKKIILLILLLFLTGNCFATTDGFEISTADELGTAVSTDSIVTLDASGSTASTIIKRTLFSGDANDFLSGIGTWVDLMALINAKENSLGNPSVSGYVLSSTTGGTRSWISVTGGSANIEDDVYGAGWNGDVLNAPSQNAVYDYLVNFDADSDGVFTDEAWFPAAAAPTTASYYTTTAEAGLSNETVVATFAQTILDDTSASSMRTTIGAYGSGDNPTFGTITATSYGSISATDIDVDASATPLINFKDSDNAGADKYVGSIEMNATTVTDGAEVSDMELYYQDAGSKTAALIIDGSDNQVELQIPILLNGAGNWPVDFCVAASDESTDLIVGTAKVTFRIPWAFTLTAVRASVNTAPTGSTLNVDINEGGTTVLSTILSIDASEETSTTAATPAVISDSSIADDAEITIDIDQVGSTTAGKGLKVCLYGTRSF